jgi:hypothetical protein
MPTHAHNIVVYLTEHEDNMAAVWACLLAGYVPCLQPALSAQQAHKEGHVTHINLDLWVDWIVEGGRAHAPHDIRLTNTDIIRYG